MIVEVLPEPRLLKDARMEHPEIESFCGGLVGYFSNLAPAKTTANEDSAALIPFSGHQGVLVVADGVGGQRGGDLASAHAVDAMTESLAEAREQGQSQREAVLNGFERANQKVLGMGIGAATTLAAVEIDGDQMRPYHVGDSMILVAGQRAKVKLTIISHSPVGYAVEAGLLDEEEAMHHDERNLVSNLVGSPEMRIDVGPVLRLDPRDTLILASDGLADNLFTEETIELVRKGRLDRALAGLILACQQHMHETHPDRASKPDDLTVLAYRRTP